MTYQELKDFCNSLTEEQLQVEVHVSRIDGGALKVSCGHITGEDQYFDHTDPLGTLDEIKAEYSEDWKDIVDGATLVPKGTVTLIE